MGAMLRRSRRLPSRYNRPITPATRSLVQHRHRRQRQYRVQQWQRTWHRLARRFDSWRALALRFAMLIVVGLFLLMVGLAIFSPILHIREIRVSRSDPRIDVEQIQRSLLPLFGEHLFFLSAQEVVSLLQTAVPDMQTAVIRKQYPSTIHLRLTLRPVIARLKIDDPDQAKQVAATGAIVTGDFLTDNGMYVVYPPAQVVIGTGVLLLRIVDWGVKPAAWTILLPPAFLAAMHDAEAILAEQFGKTVQSRTAYLRAREFHLQIPGYALWFDLKSPVTEQLERYRTFLQASAGAVPKEYVDLRLKDKIVYK